MPKYDSTFIPLQSHAAAGVLIGGENGIPQAHNGQRLPIQHGNLAAIRKEAQDIRHQPVNEAAATGSFEPQGHKLLIRFLNLND